MNTLKPLLTVAVLAGIGYGVYIRLNAGAGAPPPPVEAGWNSTPDIQLPGQSGSAPWEVPGSPGPGSAAQSTIVPGGEAPAYQPPGGPAPGGEAPPFGQAPPATSSAPPFGGAPHDAVASATPPEMPAGSPANYDAPSYEAPGHDQMSPQDGGAPSPPAANPYGGDPYAPSPGPDPYGTPQGGPAADPYGAPADSYPPGDYPLPAAEGAPVEAQGMPSGDFAATMESAQRELENGQLAAALRQLTGWYANPQLTPDQQQQLNSLLDQVAGTVVYSTQNLLEHPYEVQPGERLETIGEKYQVPWQLLAKINGIDDPSSLQPGERLKVVRGPFRAEVSIERRELVLHTADGLYAGRFKVGLGAEHPPQEGEFVVSDKSENPVYYGRESAVGAEDPNNPLGERWIGLGNQMAIHGTNSPQNIGRTDLPGWISLSEQDVEDVYDILSLGSRVTIVR